MAEEKPESGWMSVAEQVHTALASDRAQQQKEIESLKAQLAAKDEEIASLVDALSSTTKVLHEASEDIKAAFRDGMAAHMAPGSPGGWWFGDDGLDPRDVDDAFAAWLAQRHQEGQ